MTEEEANSENIVYKIKKAAYYSEASSALVFCAVFNLIFNFLRFHDFTGMSFLGKMRLPILFTISTGLLAAKFLSATWPKQLKFMSYFLIVEAVRSVVGYLIFPFFVLNDAWQVNTWLDLLMYFFGIMLPISVAFNNRKNLSTLITLFTFSGLALALWAITHSGHGPGGHLGDENDMCLVLIFLLPFSTLFASIKKNFVNKILGLGTGILLVLGIVSTQSRGGFLGFVALVFFQFILSKQKIKWIAVAAFITLVSLPFVPKQYYEEIRSIKTEASTNSGTIDERLRTWKMVIRMWKDPKNSLWGVGLENSKWNFKNYQEAGSGNIIKSLSGRATHSFYFQILGDLGVWGIVFFIIIIGTSIRQLRLVKKESSYNEKQLIKFESNPEKRSASDLLKNEINFVQSISIAMLSSWFGVLGAAVGISVAYYPTLWLMISVSTAIFLYWKKLNNISKELYEK